MNAASALSRLSQLVVLALVLTGSHAFGQAPITQSFGFGPSPGGFITDTFNDFSYYQAQDPNDTLVLTSVTLEFSGISSTGSATIFNQSNLPPEFGGPGGEGYPETLTGGFSNTFTATSSVASSSISGSVTVTSNTQSSAGQVAAGGSFTTGTLTGTETPNPQDLAVSNTNAYITTNNGTFTITIDANTSVNSSGDADGNKVYVGGNASATVVGTFTLIYNYTSTPVPEPSKTAAIFIGFGLCVLVGRNYLKSRSLRLS